MNSLPYCIINLILKYLSLTDVSRLSRVCHLFRRYSPKLEILEQQNKILLHFILRRTLTSETRMPALCFENPRRMNFAYKMFCQKLAVVEPKKCALCFDYIARTKCTYCKRYVCYSCERYGFGDSICRDCRPRGDIRCYYCRDYGNARCAICQKKHCPACSSGFYNYCGRCGKF